MEIWSEFIHEEIFVLRPASEQEIKESAVLGIVVDNANAENEELLQGILKATKIDPNSIIKKEQVDDTAKTWLVFKEELQHNDQKHSPLKKYHENGMVIILAHPLSTMRSSQNEKAELWGLLKAHFNL